MRPSESVEQVADFKQAIEKTDELLALEPEHRGCLFLKSELLVYTNDFRGAIEHTASFTDKNTMSGQVLGDHYKWQRREHALIAKCHMRLEEWETAVLFIRKVVATLNPNDAVEFRNMLDCMTKCDYHLGKYQEAIAISEGLFETNRHYEGIYEPVANCFEAVGDFDGAIRTMEQAVAYEQPWNREANKLLKAKLVDLRTRQAASAVPAVQGS
jgi:tetratricopeptide (TPR) repeat protein